MPSAPRNTAVEERRARLRQKLIAIQREIDLVSRLEAEALKRLERVREVKRQLVEVAEVIGGGAPIPVVPIPPPSPLEDQEDQEDAPTTDAAEAENNQQVLVSTTEGTLASVKESLIPSTSQPNIESVPLETESSKLGSYSQVSATEQYVRAGPSTTTRTLRSSRTVPATQAMAEELDLNVSKMSLRSKMVVETEEDE